MLPDRASAQASLCVSGEAVVFSCSIGANLASLCRSESERQALIYRFGTSQGIEFVYPDPSSGESGAFTVSEAPLVGGGVTSVIFRRPGFEYRIYSQISRGASAGADAQRDPVFEDGIEERRVGAMPRRLVCDDGGAGFREDVGWLPATPDR